MWLFLLAVFANGRIAESSSHRELDEAVACLTAEQCEKKFESMNMGGYLYVNEFPTFGCFRKGGNAYFGVGGSLEDMSTTDLPGQQQRIWCDVDTDEPTAEPSKQLTGNQLIALPTPSPTSWLVPIPIVENDIPNVVKPASMSPTAEKVELVVSESTSPTVQPSKKPSPFPTAQPSKKPSPLPTDQPSTAPTTGQPSASPSNKPITNSPTFSPSRKPSLSPTTSEPSQKPTSASPTLEPSISPSNRPSISPISTQVPTYPPTESPSEKPSVMKSEVPSEQPVTKMPTYIPTISPSMNVPVTVNPTKQPTTMMPTYFPTSSPEVGTEFIVDDSASVSKPGTDNDDPATSRPTAEQPTTQGPTQKPVPPTRSPSAKPTPDPTHEPTTADPSTSPSAKPTPDPTHKPTEKTVSSSPTKKPSKKPTKKPTQKPVTDSPTAKLEQPLVVDGSASISNPADNATKQPTNEPNWVVDSGASVSNPTTELTTTKDPTSKPVTESPSKQPTPKPFSNAPSGSPTHQPMTSVPTYSPTLNPVTDAPSSSPTKPPSVSPTMLPSGAPSTMLPSRTPSRNPTPSPTAAPTKSPSSNSLEPTTNPTKPPTSSSSGIIISNSPASMPLQMSIPPTILAQLESLSLTTEEQDDSTSPWYPVDISPFAMTLQTDSQTESLDTDELSYLLSRHLLKEMQSNDVSAEATRVSVDITPTHGRQRDLQLAFGNPPAKDFSYAVNGKAYFEGSSPPTSEELNVVIQKSFEGDSKEELLRSLQNAEDAGLKTTNSILVDVSNEPIIVEDGAQLIENRLGTTDNTAGDDPVVGNTMMILSIVFGVGFVLLALYVWKTRSGRRAMETEEDVAEELQNDEESCEIPELPRYIEVENIEEENEDGDDVDEEVENGEHEKAATITSGLPLMSVFGSIRNAMTSIGPSPNSPEVITSSANVDAGGESPQDEPPLEVVISGNGRTSGTSSRKLKRDQSGIPSDIEVTQMADSTSQQSGSRSTPTQKSQGTAIDLPCISEPNNDVIDWNFCGAFDEPLDGTPEANAASNERPSCVEEENDFGCYCGDDVEAAPTIKSSRIQGHHWGQKPDDESITTSRVSNLTETNKTER